METVILPSKSIPSISVSNRQQLLPECSSKLVKTTPSANPHRRSLSVKPNPRITDHLDYLCRNGRLSDAVRVIDSLARRRSKVRRKLFTLLIQACIDASAIHLGRRIHSIVELVKNEDSFVRTKLVSMYSLSGLLEDARGVFDRMRERNLYTWMAMIGAYLRERRWREVVDMFYLMMEDGFVPDGFLATKILQACANCGDVKTGELIHSIVIRRAICGEAHVGNSILAVYSKCGRLSSAMKLFEEMKGQNGVSWNAVITGYCQNGEIGEAWRLFELMYEKGIKPGLVTWNVFISTYNQLGRCDLAREIMDEMKNVGITPDVFTWTSMISGLARSNKNVDALEQLRKMLLAGVKPNEVTLIIALSACASLGVLKGGMELHSLAVRLGFCEEVIVGNSLIEMYCKCRKLEAARNVFDMILCKDAYTWNSMMAGYFQAGYCGQAYDLYTKMRKSSVKPNVITWNLMITGYMETGDEDLAIDLFHRMEKNGSAKRDTASWNALIAGYLQNGEKNKALGIFRQMQSFSFTPNSVTILSVLPACANLVAAKKVKEIHCCVMRRNLLSDLSVGNCLVDSYAKSGNISYSKAVFENMQAKDIITWNTLISNYVLHGRWFEALNLFDQMKIEGFKPNSATFVNLISAYGLAKMVEKGTHAFSSMIEEYHIVPHLDHYAVMVDLYGSSGRIKEAMEFIKDMPVEPNISVWTSLFTACRSLGNKQVAVIATKKLLELEPWNPRIQYLVLQTNAICGISEDSLSDKNFEKRRRTSKTSGWSYMEIENRVYYFLAGDRSQPEANALSSRMKSLAAKVMRTVSNKGLHIEEEEDENAIGIHSEKLALAFAFINSPKSSQSVRIVKNLRICRGCHTTIKYISKAYGREIYIRDSKRLHHFKDGQCSCCDYW